MIFLSTIGMRKVESGDEFQWIDDAMEIVVSGKYAGGFCELTGRINGKVRRTGCAYAMETADIWSFGNQAAIAMVQYLREKVSPPPHPKPLTQREAVQKLDDYQFSLARSKSEVRLGYCVWPRTEGGDAT